VGSHATSWKELGTGFPKQNSQHCSYWVEKSGQFIHTLIDTITFKIISAPQAAEAT
jgi:hypothetical protein